MDFFLIGRLIKENFYRLMGETNRLKDVHAKDLEKINDNKWLQFILDHHDGNPGATVLFLIKYCWVRNRYGVHNKKYNVKQDKKFSKTMMPVGKDSEGFKVLFFDLAKFSHVLDGFEFLNNLIYWMERLHRQQENKKISLLLYHGTEKNMEICLPLVEMICELTSIYPGFVKSYFIIEDFLSRNCRRELYIQFGNLLTLIKESDMSDHIKLDENFEISGSSLKIRVPKKSKEDPKSTDSQTSQIKADFESTIEDIQEKDVNNDQKKLKNILAELHNVENVVFKLIRNVQDLISENSYKNLHHK